jgi:hypothetical protein
MTWPGSQLPPLPPGMNRLRTKSGKRRRNTPTSTERLMIATARRLGVAAKPKKTTAAIGRCLDHVFSDLGFTSAWHLASFIDHLAARTPGKRGNIRLPAWKTPEGEGVRYVVGVRCTNCKGAGCGRCQMYGWGVRLVVAVTRRATRCEKHEPAPETTPAE